MSERSLFPLLSSIQYYHLPSLLEHRQQHIVHIPPLYRDRYQALAEQFILLMISILVVLDLPSYPKPQTSDASEHGESPAPRRTER